MAMVVKPLAKFALTVGASAIGAGPLSTLTQEIALPILSAILGKDGTDWVSKLSGDVANNLAGDYAKEFFDSLKSEPPQELHRIWILALRQSMISSRDKFRKEHGKRLPITGEWMLPDDQENFFTDSLAKLEHMLGDKIDLEIMFKDQPALDAIYNEDQSAGWTFLDRNLTDWAGKSGFPGELRELLRWELPGILSDQFSTLLASPQYQQAFTKHQAHFTEMLYRSLSGLHSKVDTANEGIGELNWKAEQSGQKLDQILESLEKLVKRYDSIVLAQPVAIQIQTDLTEFRKGLIRKWSQEQYWLDKRFAGLTLEIGKGENEPQECQKEDNQFTDLRDVLQKVEERHNTRVIALLGAPGSGKSTLLRRLQLDHSIDRMIDGRDEVSLLVQLKDYCAQENGVLPQPAEWLESIWKYRYPTLKKLHVFLQEGRVWLLLDALNEMPHNSDEDYYNLVESWCSFVQKVAPAGNRILFTCRSLDYRRPLCANSLKVHPVNLLPMNEDQIRSFLRVCVPDSETIIWSELVNSNQQFEFYRTPYSLKLLCGQIDEIKHVPNKHKGFVQQARVSTHRLPRPLTEHLYGRESELKLLDEAWGNQQTNIIIFHAMGGAGKSALISHWLAELSKRDYDGASAVFAWSFFSQGAAESRSDSSEAFIDSTMEWFGETPNGSYESRAERLAEILNKERALIILDGLEPLQYPPNSSGLIEGALKDRPLLTLLDSLAARQIGLCIVTTRERLTDLNAYASPAVIQRPLDQLSDTAGKELLYRLNVSGSQEELQRVVREFKGHAYGLTLLGSYLAEVLDGDINRRDEIENLFDEARFGLRADAMLGAYEKWLGEGVELAILQILALFNRPAEDSSIIALRTAPAIKGLTDPLFQSEKRWPGIFSKVTSISEHVWQQALAKLRRLNLVSEVNPLSPHQLDAHPLVREHFKQQLMRSKPEAWVLGNLRLYKHLAGAAAEYPDTVTEMMLLYSAIVHGCAAGRHQEVLKNIYWRRISRQKKIYSTRILGASGADLAALSCFFDVPWYKPVSGLNKTAKMHVLGLSAFNLRAQGRLKEVPPPAKELIRVATSLRSWHYLAMATINLAETYLILGDIEQALKYAKQGVHYADLDGDSYKRMVNRMLLADALNQAGRVKEAKTIFHDAEEIQKHWEGSNQVDYSWQWYRYYELLLDQKMFSEVIELASKTLDIAKRNNWPLDIALDSLSLGRAYLLQCYNNGIEDYTQASEYLQQAVDGLRRAGQQHHMPRGLLARSAMFRMARNYSKAWFDVDEAMRIAVRSDMRLHLADCFLESARISLATGDRDRGHQSLEKGKTIIKQIGFHRRDGEVHEIAEIL